MRDGSHGHVVNYGHVIHSLRKKPFRCRGTSGSTALMGLVYRDQLFPRQAFRDTFTALLERTGEKATCRMTVDLLALALDRGCEAELAEHLEEDLRQHRIPEIPTLRALFGPSEDALPTVQVQMADLTSYKRLISSTASAREVTV